MKLSMDDALALLRSRARIVSKPASLPSEAEVASFEELLGRQLHRDLRRLLLVASDVSVGTLEPVTLTNADSQTYFLSVIESARSYGVPESLLPICEDNADFYCLDDSGSVVYWSHNGNTGESWPDLATWIVEVWIGEA